MMNQSGPTPSKCVIALAEWVFVATVGAGLAALLYPAINAARQRSGVPLILPWLQTIVDQSTFGFLLAVPVLTALSTWLLLSLFRRALPSARRERFPWFKPLLANGDAPHPVTQSTDSRPAIASAICSLLGSCLLIVGVWHVRSDRTRRQPVITWEGPLAEYIGVLFATGWVLSGLGMAIGAWAISRFCGRYNRLAYLGSVVGQANLFVSCIVTAGLYED